MPQNLIRNGDFEDGLAGWQRAHRSADAAIQVVGRDDRAGRCVRLNNAAHEHVDLCQTVALERGQRYVLAYDLKRSKAGDDVCAFVLVKRTAGQDYYYSLGGGQMELHTWQPFARIVSPPGNLQSAKVYLLNRIDGADAWFDHLELVPVGAAAPGTGDTAFTPKLWATATAEPPTIDGRLDDAAWAEASRLFDFWRMHGDAPAEAATEARLLYDRQHLYLGVRCQEPEIEGVVAHTTQPDEMGIFGDDVVEIFLDPDHDANDYYHLAINSQGVLWDAQIGDRGAQHDAVWDSGAEIRTRLAAGFWVVELRLPFAALDLTNAGDLWGLNVGRERKVRGHGENTCWSATFTNFNRPDRFGDLAGMPTDIAPPSDVAAEIADFGLLAPGRSHLTLTLTNRSPEPRAAMVRATFRTASGEILTKEVSVTVPAQQSTETVVPYPITARGEYAVQLALMDAATGQPLGRSTTTSFTVPPLLTARLLRPWHRGKIFSRMKLREIEVEAEIALREDEWRGLRLEATLAQNGETVRQAEAAVSAATMSVQLPAADLADGEYDLTVRLCGGDDEERAMVGPLSVRQLPPAETEIWFDRQNRLVINGQPHFPLGFYSADNANWFDDLADNGFSTIHTYGTGRLARLDPASERYWNTPQWLGTAAENGLRAMMQPGLHHQEGEAWLQRLRRGEDGESLARIRAYVRQFRDHPGLLAWYLYDEPVLHQISPESMQWVHEFLDAEDPYHPHTLCLVSWGDSRYNPWFDVLLPDPYPIRPGRSFPLTFVPNAVREARRTVQDTKPVWPILQWYAYDKQTWPTAEQHWCMAYLALTGGAKGILWYGWWHGITGNKQMWPTICAIGRELRALEPVLLSEDGPQALTFEPADAPLETLVKRHEGKWYFIVVNHEKRALESITFRHPGLRDGGVVTEWRTKRDLKVADGAFAEGIEAYGVRVYVEPG